MFPDEIYWCQGQVINFASVTKYGLQSMPLSVRGKLFVAKGANLCLSRQMSREIVIHVLIVLLSR